jgi:membrane associated rhomboid family serine protease
MHFCGAKDFISMQQARLSDWRQIPKGLLNLIILNLLFFLAQQTFTVSADGFSITHTFSLHSVNSGHFKIWQIVTYMFCHESLTHLLGNMLVLWFFSYRFENLCGTNKYLLVYFISGIGAAILHLGLCYWQHQNIVELVDAFNIAPTHARYHAVYQKFLSSETYNNGYADMMALDKSWMNTATREEFIIEAKIYLNDLVMTSKAGFTLGASGAVCGVMAAYAYLFPNDIVSPMVPIPLKILVPIGLILAIYFGAFYNKASGIAHFAHAGGIIFGFITIVLINRFNKSSFY